MNESATNQNPVSIDDIASHISRFSGLAPAFRRVHDCLNLLKPFDLDGVEKIRIGSEKDGGYILANIIQEDSIVYSFGIGKNVDFDYNLALNNHKIFMFDHTIDELPQNHSNFNFFPLGITGVTNQSTNLLTLEDHINRLGHQRERRIILKMDVEGSEWDAFDTLSPVVLEQFDQIVMEVHRLGRLGEAEFSKKVRAVLSKINEQFTLFHVHSNNISSINYLGGCLIPDCLELSYVKTSTVKKRPSKTLYPTALDLPNNWLIPEHFLWSFPFFPDGADPEDVQRQMEETIERTEKLMTIALGLATEELLTLMQNSTAKNL